MEGNKAIKWRRFSRASYSAFCSLHKVVNIGVLTVAMVANADAKAKTQRDTVSVDSTMKETLLEDVEITAERTASIISQDGQHSFVVVQQDVKAAAAHSVNDLFKQMSTIDVRQRGGYGVQTDISIRGASADQTTLLLNGIDITSPQTGHLSADFPVSTDVIKQVELNEGGTGTAGTLNVTIQPDTFNRLDVQALAGMYGLAEGNLLLNLKGKHTTHLANLFADRCDGAVQNSDFRQAKLFYMGQSDKERLLMEWQCGYNRQSFGANTFYSPAFDNQWERTNRVLTSLRMETKTPVKFTSSIAWMRNYDHFQLIRDSSYGENFHRCDVFMFSPEWSRRWKGGKSSVGVNYRHESIISTNLGVPMEDDSIPVFHVDDTYYKKSKRRDILNIYLKHNIPFKIWNLNFGVRTYRNFDDEDRIRFLPFVNAKVNLHRNWTLFASWNNARRTPTFTDLFYKSPTIEGNTHLKSEFSSTASLSVRYRGKGLCSEVAGYYTHGKDMIDWVMYHSDDIFHSANFQLNNMGVELNNVLILNELFKCIPMQISVGYHYIHQEREDDTEVFKSNYSMEYLKHKLVAQFFVEPIRNLQMQLSYRYVCRNGGYVLYENRVNTGQLISYNPYGIMDFKASYKIRKVEVFGEVNNLLNETYFDYGNVPQAGIVGKVGLIYHILK